VSVTLTIVPTVGEADVIASLLRTEGISCTYPRPPWYAQPNVYEVRVDEADYERARELIEAG